MSALPFQVQVGVIDGDHDVFRRDLNVLPFEFSHTLAEHALLQMHALAEQRNLHGRSAAFRGKSGLRIHHLEQQPGYRELVERVLSETLRLAGESGASLRRRSRWFEASVCICPPGSLTAYAVTDGCTWVFQVRGTQAAHLFDRADKDVLPEKELERFYSGDAEAFRHKRQFDDRALVYGLTPGVGVHLPLHTPHWFRTGDSPSVSLHISLRFGDLEIANLYRANHLLRRAGLRPQAAGTYHPADRIKSLAFTALRGMGKVLQSGGRDRRAAAAERTRRLRDMAER